MSLHLVAAVTQRQRPSVRPARCSAAVANAYTRSGGAMETATARTARMKPTAVRAPLTFICSVVSVKAISRPDVVFISVF